MVATIPGYCWGGAPSAPLRKTISGDRYSISTTWPGATSTVASAGPTRDGRKYGVCTCTLCRPGGTGIMLRPQPAATRYPLISMTGLAKEKKNAHGGDLAVKANAEPGWALLGG